MSFTPFDPGVMHTDRRRTVSSDVRFAAQTFIVWCLSQQGWTAAAIAERAGCSVRDVTRIAERAGWPLERDEGEPRELVL